MFTKEYFIGYTMAGDGFDEYGAIIAAPETSPRSHFSFPVSLAARCTPGLRSIQQSMNILSCTTAAKAAVRH